METDRSPFPPIDLFPKLKRTAEFLTGLLVPFHQEPEPYMSTHYHGAAEMLDSYLDAPL